MPPPERTADSYGPAITAASKSVLLEVLTSLRTYRDALVLVGGWAPYFLLAGPRRSAQEFTHVGSIDIDLAVDPSTVRDPEYATIVELLTARGYRPVETPRGRNIPNSLERTVRSPLTSKPYTIRVDFLTPSAAQPPGHHVPVQEGLMARKIRGCEIAFAHQATLRVAGTLPEGGDIEVPVRVADLTAMLAMKGLVLGERYREKDAYDIYALVKHTGAGPQDAAAAVMPYVNEPLVQEGLRNIAAAFASREAHGPVWVAAFLAPVVFAAEHARITTDAFMVVREFLASCYNEGSVSPHT